MSKANDFTSKASLEFGEDVKKTSGFSEELLFAQKREVKPCGDLRHFFKNAFMGLPSFHSGYPAFLQKKWRLDFFIATRHSEPHFEAETSEFRCEMNF